MKQAGFGGPQQGADGHTTYTNKKNPAEQILIDTPGGEWHVMEKGVTKKVGSLKDGSLKSFLLSKTRNK